MTRFGIVGSGGVRFFLRAARPAKANWRRQIAAHAQARREVGDRIRRAGLWFDLRDGQRRRLSSW